MNKSKQKSVIRNPFVICLALLAVALFAAGCGGGGGGATPSTAAVSTAAGHGKVAAEVYLDSGRAAGRSAAQAATGTVDISISVSGIYSENDEEFDPVTTELTVDLSQSEVRVSLLEVPIGVNHLLEIQADWGFATGVVKAVIPEVLEQELVQVTADQRSTVIANAALALADQQDVPLAQVTQQDMDSLANAVAALVQGNNAYADISNEMVLNLYSGTAVCGNGVTEAGEDCDDGNAATEACAYGQTSCTVCDAACASVPGAASYCGDGTIDSAGGETCDDGVSNGQPNMCDSTCGGATVAVCGNGVVETGEACDDGNSATEACAYGQTSCTVCDAACASVPGAANYCGDGTIDSAGGETCDDGNAVTESCTYGSMSCTVCDATCADVAGAASYCGDGVTDGGNGEVCDDGGSNGSAGFCTVTCDGTVPSGPVVTLPFVSGGAYFACGITAGGGAKCWGNGGNGKLGNGATANSSVPVQVTGLPSGVAQMSAGSGGVCVVTDTGGAKCWGYNPYGALGNGTTTDSSTPVDVTGLTSGVAQVSMGCYHACAVTDTGGAKCWGYNLEGEVGDGTTTQRTTPVDVSGLTSGVASIYAGCYFTCALTDTGGVKCWGRNNSGQSGDGTGTQRTTPVDVLGLTSGVVKVEMDSESGHACALTTAGGLKCWGSNNAGQLGDGTLTNALSPIDVPGLTSGVYDFGLGGQVTCAITTAGGLKCWGRNDNGMVGDGTNTERHSPVDVSGMTSGVAQVDPGRFHTCAKKTDDTLWCWGWNQYGEIGDGTTVTKNVPAAVTGF